MEDLNNNKNKKNDGEEVRQGISESDASVNSVGRVTRGGRLWRPRKRQLPIQSGSGLSSDDESSRGQLPTPGRKKDRRKEFLAPRPKQHSGKEIEEQVRIAEENRAVLRQVLAGGSDSRTAVALSKQVGDDVNIILNVAAKSRNLKGTFQKALKDAAASIAAAVETLHKRTSTEETAKLQADNTSLHNELAELRKEMMELREELARSKMDNTPPLLRRSVECQMTEPVQSLPQTGSVEAEELTRSIMLQVGSMVNARFEVLEGRLPPEKRLRPPLAADKRNISGTGSQPQSVAETTKEVGSLETRSKERKKGKKGKGVPAKPNAESGTHPNPPPTQSNSMEEGWATVVSRKSKKSKKTVEKVCPKGRGDGNEIRTSVAAKRTVQPVPVKLHPPRSSAVVITLQPGAEERGVTYAKVLAKARAEIDLPGCGITGLKFRTAATGARILEVPGATSGTKADTLAQKLREILDDEEAKISRPMKCAELRISGLDDSITSQDIVTAVAKRGDCPEAVVKAGEIRAASQGTGAIWVRCPVTAAKKVVEGGRLLVGWVSAKVHLLPPRPLRCYRCLQNGHVKSQCTAEVDRSEECYRCGTIGHKVNVCSAAPKCSLCAAANRPADHRLGSKTCSPPKPKKGTRAVTKTAALQNSTATECPPIQTGDEEAMAIN